MASFQQSDKELEKQFSTYINQAIELNHRIEAELRHEPAPPSNYQKADMSLMDSSGRPKYFKVYLKVDLDEYKLSEVYNRLESMGFLLDRHLNRFNTHLRHDGALLPTYVYYEDYASTICLMGMIRRLPDNAEEMLANIIAHTLRCHLHCLAYVEFCNVEDSVDREYIDIYRHIRHLSPKSWIKLAKKLDEAGLYSPIYSFDPLESPGSVGGYLKKVREGKEHELYELGVFDFEKKDQVKYMQGYCDFLNYLERAIKGECSQKVMKRFMVPMDEKEFIAPIHKCIMSVEKDARYERHHRYEDIRREAEARTNREEDENGLIVVDREEIKRNKDLTTSFGIGELILDCSAKDINKTKLISTCSSLFSDKDLAVWPCKLTEKDGKAIITFVVRKGPHPDSRQRRFNAKQVMERKDFEIIAQVFNADVNGQLIRLNVDCELKFDIGDEYFDTTKWESKFYSFETLAPDTLFETALEDKEEIRSYKEDLENLIGLEDVKMQIQQVIDYAKAQKDSGLPISCFHMCFTGNPGTGKTTVARIVAKAIQQEQIYGGGGNFTEVERGDLVHRYVGFSEEHTKRTINGAMGSVLFIDEFYSLASSRRSDNDFGQKVIDTLNKQMEDKRNRFCLIIAGYTKQMEEALSSNPGMRDRIPITIEFPDYTAKELKEVLDMMLEEKGLNMDEKASQAALEYLKQIVATKDENFGNARLMRFLVDSIERQRYFLDKTTDVIDEETIDTVFETDSKFKNLIQVQNTCTIGFC